MKWGDKLFPAVDKELLSLTGLSCDGENVNREEETVYESYFYC